MTSFSLNGIAMIRLISPIVNDLYKHAKGSAQKSLMRWTTEPGLKNLATTISKLDKVKTIWSPEKEISLHKFYHPSKLQISYTNKAINTIDDLPIGNIVIEGIVGQGKSIFMRYLATSALHSKKTKTLPIFIELRNISSKRSLTDCISIFLNSCGIDSPVEVFNYLANNGRIVLLLDGFDEIPSECVPDIIFEIGQYNARFENLKIIISSRPRNGIQNTHGFEVLNLAPIHTSEYDSFITRLIPTKTKRFDITNALSDCNANIKGVISTPLMLTLVVMIYQTEKHIPTSLSGFFEKLFGVVFNKHDRLKAGFNRQHFTKLSEDELKELFEIFCFMSTHTGAGRSMTSALFDENFALSVKFNKNLACKNEDFRKDVIKVACLMLEEGLDTITFLHKSILDYYAAAFVRRLSDTKSSEFYSMAFSKFATWQHVLQFLKEINPSRYAKYYTLAMLPKPLAELTELLTNRDQRKLVNYIYEMSPELNITMGEERVHKISYSRTGTNEIYYDITNQLSQAILEQCDNVTQAQITHAASLVGYDRHGKKMQVILPFHIIVSEFGDNHIWRALTRVETSALTRLKEAEALANEDAQKENFLDNLLS